MNTIKNYLLLSLLLLVQICTAQTIEKPTLVRKDFKSTANNSVTVTNYTVNGTHYVYSGGDRGIVNVFSIDKQGTLTPVAEQELSNKKGPARGMVADNIQGTDYLFVGNKGANAVEVYQIEKNGTLKRVFVLDDTDKTYLGTVITLQVVHMKKSDYLFVGGLEKIAGLSCFKIHANGSLTHVQSVKDNDKIHTDGIIGMVTHKVKGKTYLYTGGFMDNGVSSFKVSENGRFKNVNNIGDNTTDRYLTGTYPLTGVTVGGIQYVIVGHRHHKYYKRGNFIKNKDFVYHGDAVSVFKINKKGALVPHSTLINDDKTKIAGQTRIEVLSVNDDEAIVGIATKDDHSIQLCKFGKDGILQPQSYITTGYPIYYGLGAVKIDEELFFVAGSVRFDVRQLVSYKVTPEDVTTKGKVLRHVVNLKFKDNLDQAKIDHAISVFKNLKNKIPEVARMEGGLNNSTEGQSKGFQYCFTITFNDEHARETYLFHKEHLKLIKVVGPLLDDAFVMDYWTSEK